MSADPLVQAPYFSQSYNRYSYVWNNPVANVDPSGYVTETSDDCGVSMGTCTIAMGPSKGSNRKVQKSDVVAGTVGGNPEAQGELAESIDWFGVKVDASDNFIVCVTPQACSSPSNIRNATLTDGVTEVAMFGAGLIPVARTVPGIIRDKVKSAVKGVVGKMGGLKNNGVSDLLADSDFQKDLKNVDCVDCDDIARKLYKASGDNGNILDITVPGGHIKVKEFGVLEEFVDHRVFSDGKNIIDPRFSNKPVAIKKYIGNLKADNPNMIVTDITP